MFDSIYLNVLFIELFRLYFIKEQSRILLDGKPPIFNKKRDCI